MLEPDFGTGMVIVATLFVMLFASNIKLSLIIFVSKYLSNNEKEVKSIKK